MRVEGHELAPEEVFVERAAPEGWVRAEEGPLSVALDVSLDPELELEGRVYDLVHVVNNMRKEQGLELTDRIVLTLPNGATSSGSSTGSSRRRWQSRSSTARARGGKA